MRHQQSGIQAVQQMRRSRHGGKSIGNAGNVCVCSEEKFFYQPRFKTVSGVRPQRSPTYLGGVCIFKNMDSEEDKPRLEPVGGGHERM